MDLLGRKLGMKKSKVFMNFLLKIHQTIAGAKQIDQFKDMAEKIEIAVKDFCSAVIEIAAAGFGGI